MSPAVSALLVPVMDAPDTSEPSGPSTSTVRIDTELVRKARIVCAHRTVRNRQAKLVEYLDGLVRGQIEADYDETMRRIAEEQQKADGNKPRKKKET